MQITNEMPQVAKCSVTHCAYNLGEACCKYNEDYECSAEEIAVGAKGHAVRCLTFAAR